MNVLKLLRDRFRPVLTELSDDVEPLLEMIRPAQDTKFGDYQANCAMPLGKQVGKPPRELASLMVDQVDLEDICHSPEVAGPGFINLRIRDDWLNNCLKNIAVDDRLGIPVVQQPRTIIIDYSSPNVAKAMHVGHIRSTVIGDALYRILKFLGHHVIGDNHLGDWGTQFGMIIYGYKHFVDESSFAQEPVRELGRLYKRVNQFVEYEKARGSLAKLQAAVETTREAAQLHQQLPVPVEKAAKKKHHREGKRLLDQAQEAVKTLTETEDKIKKIESNPDDMRIAETHRGISGFVLEETALLHQGNEENLALWKRFLPECKRDIQRIYDRLDIHFDVEYGESHYHDQLESLTTKLIEEGFATESEGAICVFLDSYDTPMIVRKRDGAFLYATTDLATIEFRAATWHPDTMLYVVDHRQSDHFEKLFDVARKIGHADVEFQHVKFGTVLGEDKRPYRTRSGDVVGLEGLLNEAVERAYAEVVARDDGNPAGPQLDEATRQAIAPVIGIGAIKYADLSHNRTSDYVFSYKKMLAMEGNTGPYLQYSYARAQGIFAKGEIDPSTLRETAHFEFEKPIEHALALQLMRMDEALAEAAAGYQPHHLTSYLYELAKLFHKFFDQCPVLAAESDSLRNSRLMLCDLVGRTIRDGLGLLGIHVVDRM